MEIDLREGLPVEINIEWRPLEFYFEVGLLENSPHL